MKDRKKGYTDDDVMSFGKHKGEKMQDVPASYLHWLYTSTDIWDTRLKLYIEENMNHLKEEYPNGIWKIK